MGTNTMDVTQYIQLPVLLRLAYLAAALAVLVISAISAFNSRFLAYGARSATAPSRPPTKTGPGKQRQTQSSLVSQVLDQAAAICVPHSWFTSFYAVSVTCSLFWAHQLVVGGPAFDFIRDWSQNDQAGSMTIRQVFLGWGLMALQGSRRLYECLTFSQSSESRMWVGHWVLGVGFYIGTSIAIWIEGIPAIESHAFSAADLAIAAPNVRSFVGILLFILASGFQHDCHAYLASLKNRPSSDKSPKSKQSNTSRYKLPEHPAFSGLIAPHYTAECIIYLALALIATPSGAWLNWTLACALVFVAVNLGVTAAGTKQWYQRAFGVKAVEKKWILIPFIW